MYEIKVKTTFSAAHNLRNYRGKCELLHGHNWQVEAVFAYETLGKDGLAVDFREAKKVLRGVTERLDHGYLNRAPFFKKTNPTSENIARFIYGRVKAKNGNIRSVSVWENENSCATYSET
ncbi:MAG: 6-carboxytetrahydropterin synthase QueD [Candidatus Omnitrophota bacterium]